MNANDDSKKPDMADGGELRRRLADWLANGRTQAPDVDAAVRGLAGEARSMPERAMKALSESPSPDSPCVSIRESLPDYIQLGADADSRMPGVRVHLDTCADCSAQYEMLRTVAQATPSWKQLADLVGASSARLVLSAGAWHWQKGASERAPLSHEDIAASRRILSWFLQPLAPSAFAFSSGSALPEVCIATDLPQQRVRLRVNVIPEYVASEHTTIWRIQISLDPGASVPELWVGLGNEDRPDKGSRTLISSRQIEFLAPPPATSYWLHIVWRKPDGSEQRTKLELPLRHDSAEGS
jgi:hypothetical protein